MNDLDRPDLNDLIFLYGYSHIWTLSIKESQFIINSILADVPNCLEVRQSSHQHVFGPPFLHRHHQWPRRNPPGRWQVKAHHHLTK